MHNTKRNNDRNHTLDKNYNNSNSYKLYNNNNNNNNYNNNYNNSNNGTDDAYTQNRRDYELTDMYILNSHNTHAMTDTTDDNYTNRFSDSISHSPPPPHPSLSSTSTNVVIDMIDRHFSIHNMIRDFNESMPVVVLPSNFEVRKGILIDSDPKNRLLHSVYYQQYDDEDDEVEVEEDDDCDDDEDDCDDDEDSKNYNDKNNDDCDKNNNNDNNNNNDTG